MDDRDEKLLQLLRANARESFVSLASALGTSEGTVRARLKKLTQDGVIRKFTIRTAGANINAIIEVAIETNVHTGGLAAEVATWEGIEAVFEISGDYDILVIAQAKDTDGLNAIIDKIRGLPHVQSTRSRLILKEL